MFPDLRLGWALLIVDHPKQYHRSLSFRLGICSGRKVEKTFSIFEISQFFFQDKWLLLWLL